MLFLNKDAIGREVVVSSRMSAPNQPFTIEPGARGVVKHVTVMMGQQIEPDPMDPKKSKATVVEVPVAWVDFWGNGVCFAVVGENVEYAELGSRNGVPFPKLGEDVGEGA